MTEQSPTSDNTITTRQNIPVYRSIALRLPFFFIITLVGIAVVAAFSVGSTISTRSRNIVSTNLYAIADSAAERVASVIATEITSLETIAANENIQAQLRLSNREFENSELSIPDLKAVRQQEWEQSLGIVSVDPLMTMMVGDFTTNETSTELSRQLLAGLSGNNGLLVVNRYGAIVGANYLPPQYDYSTAGWLQEIETGRDIVLRGRYLDKSVPAVDVTDIAIPIRDTQNGEIIGYIRGSFDFSNVERIIEQSRFNQSGRSALIDQDGNLMYTVARNNSLAPYEIPSVPRANPSPAEIANIQQFVANGESYLTTATLVNSDNPLIDELEWIIATIQPEQEALAPIRDALLPAVSLASLFALIAVAVLYSLYIRPLTSDLNKLRHNALQFQDNLDAQPVILSRDDELSILARSFNQMAARIRHELYGREQIINERTSVLRKRAAQLEASVRVGREANASLELDKLMKDTVELIRDGSNYYHASIFLIDEEGEYAVVRESTGDVGHVLKSRPHKLAIGSNSVVGRAAATRQPFLARNVGEELNYFDNPLLPETQSEVALPLIAQGGLLGVLDVQSRQLDAFTEDDLKVLQLMADQVASAIYNARLYASTLKRTQQQRQVLQLWKELEDIRDTAAILEAACTALVEQFQYPGVYIAKIEGQEMVIHASAAGADVPLAPLNLRKPTDMGLAAQVLASGSAVLIATKTETDPSLYDRDLPGTLSEIVLPIEIHQQITHLLVIYSPEAGTLDETDETLLLLVAEALGSIMANAQLLSEKDASLRELNRLYHHSLLDLDTADVLEEQFTPQETTAENTPSQPHTIPLVVRDQVIGEIAVETEQDTLSEAETSLINTIADQTAFALENSRLFAQTQVRLREQEALYNLSSHLTATLDEQEIYRRATRAFAEQLYASQCSLAIWEKPQNSVTIRAEYIKDKENPTLTGHYTRYEMRSLEEYPHTAAVLEEQITQLRSLKDKTLPRKERRLLMEAKQTKSLEVPLSSGDLVLGSITLYRDDSQPDFEMRDIRLAQAMASQTAVALQNALLTTRARVQISQLSTLNRISRQLALAETLRDIFETLRREILPLTKAIGTSISLITDDNKVRWAYAYEHGSENDVSAVPLQEFGVGLTGHVLTTREPLLLSKNTNLEEYLRMTGSFSVGNEPEAWLGVPMILADKLLGALVIESDNASAFDDRHVQLMTTIASTTAIAINNLQQLMEIRNRRQMAERLYAIGRNISMSDSPAELLEVLAQLNLLQHTRATTINLFEVTASSDSYDPYVRVLSQWQREGYNFAPLTTPDHHLTNENYPLIDYLSSDRAYQATADEAGGLITEFAIEQVAVFPLMVGQLWIGFLTLYGSGQQWFNEDQLRDLSSLASQIAAVVQNQRLLIQTQEALQAQEQQSLQLRTAAEVAAAASSSDLGELTQLMQNSVDLIKERFDLYYVGIFLVDDAHEYAILTAGTGEEGQAQIARRHRLKIGSRSLVGGAVADGESRIHQNIYEAQDWYPNPNLPDTQSEIALPLKVRNRIIGALTVQSKRAYMFPPEFVSVLQTMTNQIAVAIDNADLFNQIQHNLNQTAALYETGRRLTEADSEYAIYKTLIDFVATNKTFDAAYVITADPTSTVHRYVPLTWNLNDRQDGAGPRRVRASHTIPNRSDTSLYRIIPDVAESDYFSSPQIKTLFEINSIRSCCMLRIFVNDLWVASLALLRRHERVPTAEELQPFISLADQAAVILTNQRLLKETSALYRLGRSLSAAMTQEEVAQVTIDEIVSYTNVEQSRVIFFDTEHTQAQIAAAYQPTIPEEQKRFPVAPDNFLTEQFQNSRRPIILEDSDDERASDAVETYLRPFGIQTSLIIPAFSQNTIKAFITLDSYQGKQQFTESVINFSQVAVDQFTTTIENIIFFDDALKRAQEMITLNQISSRIAATLDIEQIGTIVYNEVDQLLNNDVFLLAEFEPDNNTCRPLVAMSGDQSAQTQGELIPLKPNAQITTQIRQPDTIILNTADPLAREIYTLVNSPTAAAPQSTLFIPMHQEGHPTAFLAVQSMRPKAYTDEQINLLRSISNQTVLGLSNARLLRETTENVAELRTLFNVTQSIASTIDATERVERMVETLHHSLHQVDVTILILDEEEALLEIIAHRGRPPRQKRIPTVDDNVIGKALHYGTPVLVNDLRELDGHTPTIVDTLAQLTVPLTFAQRTIGVINVESPSINVFTERDLRLLQTLSVSLAATIESGRSFQALQEANKQLRELDRLKTQFLANMSHELRTPLNSIIGFSRLILKGIDGPITEMQKEDLSSIYNSGQHLLNLINDILDLAKIDAGKMSLVFDHVNLNELCQSVLATARGLVRDESIELIWDIEPDLPAIKADPVRLRQILLNLLSNAAKFTQQGHISLTVRQAGENEVQLTVEDTGIGIAEENFPRLFQAFEQVDDSPSRAVDGTGLGLPIVHELVQLHQGTIWVESEVGQGSTFYITLPIQTETVQKQDSSTVASPSDNGHNSSSKTSVNGHTATSAQPAILLVDDEPGILTLYQRYLDGQPFELICAENGNVAMEELHKRPQEIALVIMDVFMPDLDGWDVLQQMQQDPTLAKIPVVLCSVEDDTQKALQLGAHTMLPKPIIADDLLEVIKEIDPPIPQ